MHSSMLFGVGLSRHSDILVDYETKSYYWYRPPFPHDDVVWKDFNIIPLVPDDPLGLRFLVLVTMIVFVFSQKFQVLNLSMEQITDLLSLALTTVPCVGTPI